MKKAIGFFLSVIMCASFALFTACGETAGNSHSCGEGGSADRSEATSGEETPGELESNETPRIPLD